MATFRASWLAMSAAAVMIPRMARKTGLFQKVEDRETLYENIPEHLRAPLFEWMDAAVSAVGVGYGSAGLREVYKRYDLQFRPAEPLLRRINGRVSIATNLSTLTDDEVLQLIDWCVLDDAWRIRDELAELLEQGGSAWTVYAREDSEGDEITGLERRVPEGVKHAADDVMSGAGHAGRRLADAWQHAFGRNPDPRGAYRDAVHAVEDAAKPVVSPTNTRATLGTMIANIEQQKNWTLPLQRTDSRAEPGDVLLGMMRALWVGQADRHGGDPDPALVITQEAAETAVLLAVPLVSWFDSQHAQRKP